MAEWWSKHKSVARGDRSDEQLVEDVQWFFCRSWYDCRCSCIKTKDCHKDPLGRLELIPDDADWGMLLDRSVDPPHMLGAMAILMAKGIRKGVKAAVDRITILSLDLVHVNLIQAYHALRGVRLFRQSDQLLEVLCGVAYMLPARMSDMIQNAVLRKQRFPDQVSIVQAMATGTHGWGVTLHPWQVQAVFRCMKMCIKLGAKAHTSEEQNPFGREYAGGQSFFSFFAEQQLSFNAEECDLARIFSLIESEPFIHKIVQYLPINQGVYRALVSKFVSKGRLCELVGHLTAVPSAVKYPHPVEVVLDDTFGLRFTQDSIRCDVHKRIKEYGAELLAVMAMPDPHENFSRVCQESLEYVTGVIREYLDKEVLNAEETAVLRGKMIKFIGYSPYQFSIDDLDYQSREKRARDEQIAAEIPQFVKRKTGVTGIVNFWSK